MKKFLLSVLLLPAVAMAQPVTVEKPVVCEKLHIVIESLQNSNYKEVPIWSGIDEKSKYALFANEKTKTWTFIQFNQNIACILGVGEKSQLIFTGPKL